MSELRIQSWSMPAANLGFENPLPPLFRKQLPPQLEYPPDIPNEMLENLAYGHLSSKLPYTVQDGYERQLQPAEFRTAVLENEILRATFLLEFGGRLWSLFHKPSGRELLEVNKVFQLANLAIRNAWFSSGVEWNIGTVGHSPLTCSPLFASCLERSDGTPILRLSEWERFRQTPFQIDAYLPDGSPVLFLRMHIMNPNEHEVPMYWWSNIAVPESSDTRVIAPSESAFCLGCKPGHLTRIPVPNADGIDITYSKNAAYAADYFFDIPDGQYPWITALDGEGCGLVQVSTGRMMGRKLWVWGREVGGRNWQKFLSPPGDGYIEIQAGLTRTQLEHLRMPAGAEWSWLEAYGLLEADPGIVHGSDWVLTRQHINEELDNMIPRAALSIEHEQGAGFADATPIQVIQQGSGWGALENRRREVFGEPPINASGLSFNADSLSDEQMPWINLLEGGSFPVSDPGTPPRGYLVGEQWLDLLERKTQKDAGKNWLSYFHLGVMRHYAGDLNGSQEAWERSLSQEWTPWAARNLAVLAWEDGGLDEAADLLVEAFDAAPGVLSLAVECGRCLIEAGRTHEWLERVLELPQSIRSTGRIRLMEAQAALAEGELEKVEKFFSNQVIVADLREGENTLTDLWFGCHEHRLSIEENVAVNDSLRARVRAEFPLPKEIDFRMRSA